MKKPGMVMAVALMVLGPAVSAWALPVNLPEGIKSKDKGILLPEGQLPDTVRISAAGTYDYFSRDMNDYEGEVTGQVAGGKITISFVHKMDLYVTLGGQMGTRYNYHDPVFGDEVTFKYTDDFAWGIGMAGTLYEWEEEGWALFADGGFRRASGMDYRYIEDGWGTHYPADFESMQMDVKWTEWQVALGASKDLGFATTYFGVKYSDATLDARATFYTDMYDLGDDESEDNFGVFVGVVIFPAEGVSLDVCGRFLDEQAIYVSLTVRV
ncbi:MAG: hypothetical protein HQL11_03915 [Candidatus Omnitrophica bacterium]|nr:hypothetical protein [Candidatus Omnitrophota bacterium]